MVTKSADRTTLRQLLSQQLGPFGRVAITGCDVSVTPFAAQQFALIVHELATNALKYGALSVPEGRVAIDGTIERANGADQHLLFVWTEMGGPRPSAPSRKGSAASFSWT